MNPCISIYPYYFHTRYTAVYPQWISSYFPPQTWIIPPLSCVGLRISPLCCTRGAVNA